MFKRIKIEWYFIRRVLNPKYSPECRLNFRCYFNYFKNRFFGNIMASWVEPCEFSPNKDFELHILSQGGNLWMTIWSLKSFVFHSQLCPKIIIHNDGSIDERAVRILKEKFSGLEVISRQEADDLVFNRSSFSERVKKFRRSNNNLLLRIIDIPLLSRGSKIMILGDDVLFFKRPREIVNFVNEKSHHKAIASQNDNACNLGITEEYCDKYKLKERRADLMNPDVLVYDKDCITDNMIEEYFENTIMGTDYYFMELAGFACMIGQNNFSYLPIDTYHIKGPVSENTVMKHFTNPRRQDFFAYGIDVVKNTMEKARQG